MGGRGMGDVCDGSGLGWEGRGVGGAWSESHGAAWEGRGAKKSGVGMDDMGCGC